MAGARVEVSVARVDVQVPQRAVQAWANEPNGPVFGMLDEIATRVQFDARSRVGFHTGRLHNSIRKQRRNGANPSVAVVAGLNRYTPYLGWHMFGTEAHEIRPRTRRALRWAAPGGVRFATRVWHPGTRANPFLTDALDAATL